MAREGYEIREVQKTHTWLLKSFMMSRRWLWTSQGEEDEEGAAETRKTTRERGTRDEEDEQDAVAECDGERKSVDARTCSGACGVSSSSSPPPLPTHAVPALLAVASLNCSSLSST